MTFEEFWSNNVPASTKEALHQLRPGIDVSYFVKNIANLAWYTGRIELRREIMANAERKIA